MTQSSSGLMWRVRSSIKHWMHSRLEECVHCRGCDSEVTPFVSHCPKCGQANPAKVSATAAIYPAIVGICVMLTAFVLLEIF
jgi:hypothetical protein